MGEEKKRTIFDRLKGAVDQVMLPHEVKGPAPLKRAATSGAIGGDAVKLTAKIPSGSKATGGLGQGKQTSKLPENNGPSDRELSPRRLAMIDDYMKGEAKIEAMKDPAFMYKIVSDERAYQTRLLIELRKRGAQVKPGPKADELNTRIQRSQAIVTNLFKVLKRITGKQGSTGGTDFLSDGR